MIIYYISITGLELTSFLHTPKFWYYAIPAMIQAKNAPGNISAENAQINGVQHTLSVWKDRKSMLNYMRSGNHVKAMKVFDDIATGKTYGYESEVVPTWEEVLELYNTKARVVGRATREEKEKPGQEKRQEDKKDHVNECTSSAVLSH